MNKGKGTHCGHSETEKELQYFTVFQPHKTNKAFKREQRKVVLTFYVSNITMIFQPDAGAKWKIQQHAVRALRRGPPFPE